MTDSKLNLPGLIAGCALAPFTALGSYARRARVFHPCGTCLLGTARAVAGEGPLHEVGARLDGAVLVRFSGAWWKQHEWPDVLGCALRFGSAGALAGAPRSGDQDLLLATIRTPLTTLLAPLSTGVHDYLANAYFGVSPFRVTPLGRIKLRLVAATRSVQGATHDRTREQRLMRMLERGPLRLTLEARAHRLGARYRAIAEIELVELADIDQQRLHFDPFATGRGFVPVGFVHGLRVAAYAASRRARDAAVQHHDHPRPARTRPGVLARSGTRVM